MISVHVNGKHIDLPRPTPLLDYVRELGVDPRAVAVEVNGVILRREAYAGCTLRDGDTVEIVRMVGGGAVDPPAASPTASALGFVDCINRGDVVGLGRLMTEDHVLKVFEEAPVSGRQANIAAWRGYTDAFPRYRIYADEVTERARRVAILGRTTGSHLGLPDDQEGQLTLIWVADVSEGAVRTWTLVEDTADNRRRYGFSS